MFLAALPRVARLPVGDLARLAAVAAFAARAADGEGGLIVSRESAADVARSSTPCSRQTMPADPVSQTCNSSVSPVAPRGLKRHFNGSPPHASQPTSRLSLESAISFSAGVSRRMARRAAPAPFVDLFFALAPLTRRLGAARPCGMLRRLPRYRDIYDS